MKVGSRKKLFGVVLSRMSKKRPERGSQSISHEWQSKDEACTSEDRLSIDNARRSLSEKREEHAGARQMSVKEHQLRKYRINVVKSPCNLDDDDRDEDRDERVSKGKALNNSKPFKSSNSPQRSEHDLRLQQSRGDEKQVDAEKWAKATSFPSDGLSTSRSTQDEMSSSTKSGRSEDQKERDTSKDDEELSFRGGYLGKDPRGSNMAEYGNSSQGECPHEDEIPSRRMRVTRNISARKHSSTVKLVKYMSHREGSEKGFEVLLEDFRKFVTYCTVERGATEIITREESTNRNIILKRESQQGATVGNVLQKETSVDDDDTGSISINSNNSRRILVETVSSSSVDNAADEESKSIISVQSMKLVRDVRTSSAGSITGAAPRESFATTSMNSTCKCKCCGHLLDNPNVRTKKIRPDDRSEGYKSDMMRVRSELSRCSSATSEIKQKLDQTSPQCDIHVSVKKASPLLKVSGEDGQSSSSPDTLAKSTKRVETVSDTPTIMCFSMFSSFSTNKIPDAQNNLSDDGKDETLESQHCADGGDARNNDEQPEGSAIIGEERQVVQLSIVTGQDNSDAASTIKPVASTISSERATETPLNMLFNIFSSLSSQNNSEKKNDPFEDKENVETRQDKQKKDGDEASRIDEIGLSEEDTRPTAREKMTAIGRIPSKARPPLPCSSKKPASRYVTYPVERVDSHSTLRSCPPRLSGDLSRHHAKREKSVQIISPSSISQRKDNGWNRCEV
jgi:hypothetical protein